MILSSRENNAIRLFVDSKDEAGVTTKCNNYIMVVIKAARLSIE